MMDLDDRTAQNKPRGLLKLEIPLSDGRVAVVNYPNDLTEIEATKIGNVLGAIVSKPGGKLNNLIMEEA